jgi:hypothetical protein
MWTILIIGKLMIIQEQSPAAIDNFMIIKEKLCSPSGNIPITPEVHEEKEEGGREKQKTYSD